MDQDKIYQLQDAIHQFRRSQQRHHISSVRERLSDPKGALGFLVHNINRINRLSQAIKVVLPEPLAQHCRATNFEDNQLVLTVDSGQWASRLRYEKLELLSFLRQNGFAEINGIDIIVNPEDFKTQSE